MEKATLICLLLTATSAAANDDRGVGAPCRERSGAVGSCRSIADCPAAQASVGKGEAPTACFYQGFTPVVCCPDPAPVRSPEVPTSAPTPTPSPTSTPTPSPTLAQQQSVASRMCSVYANAVFRFEHTGGSAGGAQKVDQCKMAVDNIIISPPDEKANPDEYPHMALLGYGTREQPTWLCGGSLISERFVLTAAHCIVTRLGTPTIVRLGELHLKITNESKPEYFAVAQTIPHPDYKDGAYYNDIGLLRLARDAVFTSSIRPACLHTRKEIEQRVAEATGWGIRNLVAAEVTNQLMKVILPILETQVCKKEYQTIVTTPRLPDGIDEESMVCAGTEESAKDICKGDSGGPLQVKLETPYCMYSVVGITSFGKGHCGLSNFPAIYTRVSHYVPWIESVVWPNKKTKQ